MDLPCASELYGSHGRYIDNKPYIYKVWEDRGSSEPEVLWGVEEDSGVIKTKERIHG